MAAARSTAAATGPHIDHGRFGYCRVSTRGQTLEVQLAALSVAGVADSRVFAEKRSGRSGSKRPQWEDVRSRLRPGDTLVVSKLDRMGRDMREIMETAWSLQDLGARLEILSGPLTGVYDPRGMGKMFFALLAGFAELEREMMTERTSDGLAQAAAEGRRGGRPPVISRDMMRIALGRRADGESVTSIARGLTYKTAGGQERTVSRRALYNAFRSHDAEQAAGDRIAKPGAERPATPAGEPGARPRPEPRRTVRRPGRRRVRAGVHRQGAWRSAGLTG